jgi:cobalt-zinc-cadmium efflux system membrane fusion protein
MEGCTRHAGDQVQAASVTPHNVTLTRAQLGHIHLFTVASGSFGRVVDVSGVVDFDNDQATSVLAPFSGPVSRLLISPGQQVRTGQPLATVESPDYSAAVSAYSKAAATARTDRAIAEADKDLAQHNGIAPREAQQAQTDAVNAEADRDAALQALLTLKPDAQTLAAARAGKVSARVQGVIRAPISGTVVERLITPGQILQAGSTATFTVANLSRLWVLAQVAPSDLPFVRVGDPVQVDTGVGATTLTGTVDNIPAQVSPDTRTVPVRVTIANPGTLLRKQMYVRVLIRSRQRSSGLLVPVSAILRDDENLPFVYVQQADGSFARRHVSLGDRSGDLYAVADGLRPGERIVVDGAIFVQFVQTQ